MKLRKLPTPSDGKRVENGPVQFGDDWPGIFLRGDHALFLAGNLHALSEFLKTLDLEGEKNSMAFFYAGIARGSATLLEMCNAARTAETPPDDGA